MRDGAILDWFPYVFPLLFIGAWLGVTTVLGVMSGWFNLQQWYADDGSEEPLLKLQGQSGTMGLKVQLGGCLQLRAYSSGLGLRIWRIFGPFQKPLKIPWNEIEAESRKVFFMPMVKLHLGKPSNGTLTISPRSWSRLVSAAGATTGPLSDVPPASRGAAARGAFIQWALITGLFGTFLYLGSRSQPDGISPLLAYALPAALSGAVLLIQFARS